MVRTRRKLRAVKKRRVAARAASATVAASAAVAAQPPLPRPRASRARIGSPRPLLFGGMIAIGGPPLGGKSVLAARLAECLPNALRLEAIDDLARARPYQLAEHAHAAPLRVTSKVLLERAKQIWRNKRPGRPPTILVVTRFGSAAERRRAKLQAQLAGMPFLFVEVRSKEERALLRVPMSTLSPSEIDVRMRRYDAALAEYVPMSRAEALALPGLRLDRVLSRLDAAVGRVLAVWKAR